MLRVLTAGESHGPCLVAIIEGLPSGIKLDVDAVNFQLSRRQKGYGRNHRQKIEHDQVEVLGGLVYGQTTGAPLALRIENRDWQNWRNRWEDGSLPVLTVPRPGHADYAGMIKYGLSDARPILERASARETAMRVAVGAVTRQILALIGIQIGSYVKEIGGVTSNIPEVPLKELFTLAEASEVRCPDPQASENMKVAIDHARQTGDTLGGLFTAIATGIPVGLGSHVQWDRRLDVLISSAIMSIPSVKGVEIGPAFENSRLPGSVVHDDIYPSPTGGVMRKTNRAGGIEGGISNGADIIVSAAMKPIPTTAHPHASIDLSTNEAVTPIYQRSDFCAVPAGSVIGEAMLAWILTQALLEKKGGDSIKEMTR